jgi:Leishmanolysin
VIRRVYGEDNRAVRAEMRRIEERIPRYQTGIPGDLNHVVPYENHPYEKSKWRRRLENSNSTSSTGADNATSTGNGGETYSTNGTTADGSSGARFQPMRIKYFTYALDAIRDDSNAAKIDWYINTILPKTVEFWSRALSVVPVSGNLKLSSSELDSRLYCGDSEFTEVPSEHISDGVADADLILYVSASSSTLFCPDRTLAVAVPCEWQGLNRRCLLGSGDCVASETTSYQLTPRFVLTRTLGNFDQFDRPIAGSLKVGLISLL